MTAVNRMPGPRSPLMTAWYDYSHSENFKASLHAGMAITDPKRVEGAMWAAFVEGFSAAGGQITEESSR